jgi:hypothetical protein
LDIFLMQHRLAYFLISLVGSIANLQNKEYVLKRETNQVARSSKQEITPPTVAILEQPFPE